MPKPPRRRLGHVLWPYLAGAAVAMALAGMLLDHLSMWPYLRPAPVSTVRWVPAESGLPVQEEPRGE